MSMARTCSKCGNKGHNSRTCWSTTQYYWTQQLDKPKERRSGNSSLRLFGVQLDHHDLSSSSSSSSVSVISRNVIKRKRRIMDYCNSWSSSSPHLTSCLSGYRANIGINRHDQISRINNGGIQETNYNKGVGWSEEEHRKFLEGIETLGKGDWRGISKHYVTTRSPTQVASHAQKYFLRLQISTTADTATINNLDFNFDPHKKRCRVSKDQLVSPRQLIDINTDNPNTEASVNNPYECWPAVHYSTPLRIDVNLNNSSSQSAATAAAAGGGLDLELKLAVSIMPLGLDQ
ncbi:probable transcription factor At5g61620 [Rosa chinensis]|uniref:probable transcription factor At5g61620 n=1 Tax=Rosa chinensis TaxID=74649 RepID=UPI000D093BA0|nr:probable transcription factor At5g61620 [Rosa chinensis]